MDVCLANSGVLSKDLEFPPKGGAGNPVALTVEICVNTCSLNAKKYAVVGKGKCCACLHHCMSLL